MFWGRERQNLHMDCLNQTHVLSQASTAGLHTQDKRKQMICVTPCKHKSDFWMGWSGVFKMADLLFQTQFIKNNLKLKISEASDVWYMHAYFKFCLNYIKSIEFENTKNVRLTMCKRFR